MLYEKPYEKLNSEDEYTFLNTNVKSIKIKLFEIHNKIVIPSGHQSKDCSCVQDGSVLCYSKEIEDDTGYYEFHIAANGDVFAPYDSSGLFNNLGNEKMTELNLNTRYVTNMSYMLNSIGYSLMTKLDLGDNFNTINVENMWDMFFQTGYKKLKRLNLGKKFVINDNINKNNIFKECGTDGILTSVVVPNENMKTKVSDLAPAFWNTNNIITIGS